MNSDPLFDDAPVGYIVADQHGVIRRVNRAFLSWTGYEASELVSIRRVQELLTASSRIYFEAYVAPRMAVLGVADDVSLTFNSRDAHPIFTVGAAKRNGDVGGASTEVWFAFVNGSGRQPFESEALRARLRLERLQRLASVLATSVTVADVISATLAEILDGVKGDHGFVAILVGDDLRVAEGQDTSPSGGAGASALLLTHFPEIAEVIQTRTAAFLESGDEGAVDRLGSRVDGVPATRLAALPLVTGGRAHGVLCVASVTRTGFDADEQSFLVLFAELAAQSLQSARLYDEAAKRAAEASFIARLSNALDDVMSFEARCQQLVDLVVPELADYATVESPAHALRVIAVAHRNPDLVAALRELRTAVEISRSQPHSLAHALASREPQVLVEIPAEMYDHYDLGSSERALLAELAPRSYVGLPMFARGALVGTLMLVMAESNRRFELADVPHLTDIANRAAVSLENARLYDHERFVAESFQRELLGRPLPEDDRVHLRAIYQAGGELVEIGGDYFDAFFVGSDRLALAVGDVVGKGIPAATVMSQLRTALRAFALEGNGPAETLNRLDDFVISIPGSECSSVAYAEWDLRTSELVYACAGHPPPLLITEQRDALVLWDGRSALLGIGQTTPRPESRVQVPVGSTLVLYTDGLVEARERSLDEGIAEVIDVLRGEPSIDLQTLVDKMKVSDVHRDDICVLAVTSRTPKGGGIAGSASPGT